MSLLTNLVGYWPFQEGTGTTTADVASNINTGTLQSGTTFVSGIINGAVNFNRTFSQYVSLHDIPQLGDISVAAWVFPANFSGIIEIFSRGQNGGSFTQNWIFDGQSAANNWRIKVSGASGTVAAQGGTIDLLVWQHLVGTITRSGTSAKLVLYKNGLQVATGSGSVGDNTSAPQTTNIGAYDGANNTFNGHVAEVGLLSRALSAAEVSQLYNNGIGLTYPFGISQMGKPLLKKIIAPNRLVVPADVGLVLSAITSSSGFTAKYRKTFSGIGGRIGSRQPIAWG